VPPKTCARHDSKERWIALCGKDKGALGVGRAVRFGDDHVPGVIKPQGHRGSAYGTRLDRPHRHRRAILCAGRQRMSGFAEWREAEGRIRGGFHPGSLTVRVDRSLVEAYHTGVPNHFDGLEDDRKRGVYA
jgi:hypothetical protein